MATAAVRSAHHARGWRLAAVAPQERAQPPPAASTHALAALSARSASHPHPSPPAPHTHTHPRLPCARAPLRRLCGKSFAFDETGVVSAMFAPYEEGMPLLNFSTFSTNVSLVEESDLERAIDSFDLDVRDEGLSAGDEPLPVG